MAKYYLWLITQMIYNLTSPNFWLWYQALFENTLHIFYSKNKALTLKGSPFYLRSLRAWQLGEPTLAKACIVIESYNPLLSVKMLYKKGKLSLRLQAPSSKNRNTIPHIQLKLLWWEENPWRSWNKAKTNLRSKLECKGRPSTSTSLDAKVSESQT